MESGGSEGRRALKVMESFRLDGKVSLITGGARTLGYDMAEALAEAGSHLVVTSRDLSHAERAAKSLRRDFGVDVLPLSLDVREHAQVADVAALPVLSDLYGDVPVFDSVSGLIDTVDFEAALVLLNGRDAPEAMAALARAGKHMLAEKPSARGPGDLKPVSDEVMRQGLTFYPGFTTRAKQSSRDMRRVVCEGLLGDVLSVQASYFASLVEKRGPSHELFRRDLFGGGILPWLGVHYLDLILFVTGAEPQWVSAACANASGQPIDVEDVAVVTVGLEGGSLASFHTGYVMVQEPKHLLFAVYGTKGWMRWMGGGRTLEVMSEADSWFHSPGRTLTYTAPDVPGYGGTDGQYFLRRFLRACRGEEEPLLDIGDLVATLEVIEAAYVSAEQGTRVLVGGVRRDG